MVCLYRQLASPSDPSELGWVAISCLTERASTYGQYPVWRQAGCSYIKWQLKHRKLFKTERASDIPYEQQMAVTNVNSLLPGSRTEQPEATTHHHLVPVTLIIWFEEAKPASQSHRFLGHAWPRPYARRKGNHNRDAWCTRWVAARYGKWLTVHRTTWWCMCWWKRSHRSGGPIYNNICIRCL